MKRFDIPDHYRSALLGRLKEWRKIRDPRKKDFSPSLLDFGTVQFLIPRHMGFCYGVENAIEISYKALSENPGKRIFLLSQMIHNPAVNADLESRGIRFIMDTEGRQLIPWEEVSREDVVITPAFGTTREIEAMLSEMGVELATYNTTCPFVEKVWKRSTELGTSGFTVVIHGKAQHEETRATFSHSYHHAPSVIIRDMKEAGLLAKAIRGEMGREEFLALFRGRLSHGFDPEIHLRSLGVVNQTTMLATETQEIADFLRGEVEAAHGPGSFADTRDTLCYATNDNQDSTLAVLEEEADLAVVVGGYNSSNTLQLVHILHQKFPVYFITGHSDLPGPDRIRHFSYPEKQIAETSGWLPGRRPLRIVLTSGASCPDTEVEAVMRRILDFTGAGRTGEEALALLTAAED